LHDVLVRQEPQKAQLSKAAEREILVVNIGEPVPGCSMKGVQFCGQGNPNIHVR